MTPCSTCPPWTLRCAHYEEAAEITVLLDIDKLPDDHTCGQRDRVSRFFVGEGHWTPLQAYRLLRVPPCRASTPHFREQSELPAMVFELFADAEDEFYRRVFSQSTAVK